jgi:hypothetical protein
MGEMEIFTNWGGGGSQKLDYKRTYIYFLIPPC